jgi:hypothetical protein
MTTSTSDGRLFDVVIELPRTGTTIAGTWRPNEAERFAAWELTIELATRVPVIPLRDDEGMLTEALSSLHAQFGAVRGILRRHGPDLANSRTGELSFAVLAGQLVNQVLRPVLAYWHPLMENHMDQCPSGTGKRDHERNFDEFARLKNLIVRDLRADLLEFTDAFAKASGCGEFVRVQLDNEDRLYSEFRRQQARATRTS